MGQSAGCEIPPDVLIHNIRKLEQCKVGDRIEFPRGVYSHWGVYVGDGQVIHVFCPTGKCCNPSLFDDDKKGEIRMDPFLNVAGTSKAEINNDKDNELRPHSPVEIVLKAQWARCGLEKYWPIGCEMFANFCRYGEGTGEEVQNRGPVVDLLLTVLRMVVAMAVFCIVHVNNVVDISLKRLVVMAVFGIIVYNVADNLTRMVVMAVVGIIVYNAADNLQRMLVMVTGILVYIKCD